MSEVNNLQRILFELLEYHNDKTKILSKAIQQRLNKSLTNYYKSICDSFNYLSDKSDKKVIKNLNGDDRWRRMI